MKLEPVKSSSVAAVGHDPEKNELHVKFLNGDVYSYSGISSEQHHALLAAQSIGSHVHKHIRKAAKAYAKV